ncbi:MAG: prolyl oligopeptidase family serine peptidase, partial [Proteobacteria bacterium]|nr:prolyl oligopeptidase family serine peptidase [Pseudomonadota bacterium]MBU1584854.1 prolyl oligopeptidase family serine peptidase [Pseudomonadota bacterium]
MTSADSTNRGIPKGRFAVGSKTLFIHDKTRGFDAVGGVADGVRTLIAEIWYPVFPSGVTAQIKQPDYGDYVFGNKAIHARMMYDTTFFHAREIEPLYGTSTVRPDFCQKDLDKAVEILFHQKRNSYLDLPLADTGYSFPVVVSSHGDAGSRYNLSTACEHLAGHGYIVVAPDHTGNSPYSMVGMDPDLDPGSAVINEQGVYGETDPIAPFYGQTYQVFQPIPGTNLPDILKADQAVMQRVNDLRAVLARLGKMNAFGPFAGRMDLNRLGIMGKSFGGTTTLAGLELENRFKAGVAVVQI